jgi:hypothetical protein
MGKPVDLRTPIRDPEVMRRAEATFELFELGIEMMRQNLRRRHPDADDEEIRRRLVEWLHDRPWARHGDAEGRLIVPPWRRR